MADGKCECCNRERRIIGIASSGIGPFSIAWCQECLSYGAEPLWAVEAIWSADMEDVVVFHEGEYKPFSETGRWVETAPAIRDDVAKT